MAPGIEPESVEVSAPVSPAYEFQHPEMEVPGISIPEAGINVPSYRQRPQTLAEMLQQQQAALRMKQETGRPLIVPRGGTALSPSGKVIGEGAPPASKLLTPEEKAQRIEIAKESRQPRLLTPQEEAQQTRLRTAAQAAADARAEAERASREQIAEENRKAQDIRAANALLARENRAREIQGLPPLSSPPGSEIGQLERTQQGPGVRRWGHGSQMPLWLARQYVSQAGGDKDPAMRWAEADGWNIELP